MRVTVGEHDLTRNSEVPSPLEHGIAEMILHPGFSCTRKSFSHDLALLRLAGAGVSWSSTVQPACLPPNNQPMNTLNERRATAAGWGWMAENTAILEVSPNSATPQPSGRASVLQKVHLPFPSCNSPINPLFDPGRFGGGEQRQVQRMVPLRREKDQDHGQPDVRWLRNRRTRCLLGKSNQPNIHELHLTFDHWLF